MSAEYEPLAEAGPVPLSAGAGGAGRAAPQGHLLAGVSRTFALTIPELPPPLAGVVTNAYLLCRLVDTVEDDPELPLATKAALCRRFLEVLRGESAAEPFAGELAGCLGGRCSAAERDLLAAAPQVVAYTRALSATQRSAVLECVSEMAEGMIEMQRQQRAGGLERLADLDRYCHYVAGVVGIMLTRLFCDYSPAADRNRAALLRLAPSFGQGLQMTNILKDIWEDRARGFCWLPRELFSDNGGDLRDFGLDCHSQAFGAGLERMIGIAHAHLRNAFRYTLLIPPAEPGIRNFCLWALGMAVLTLRKIHRHPHFRCAREVKISRRSVRGTMLLSRWTASHNGLLRILFQAAEHRLPLDPGVEIRVP